MAVLDGMLERYPDDVRPAVNKVAIYLWFLDQPMEALKWVEVALERAYRAGFFRREALGDKARILLKLGRGEELSEVPEEIMSLKTSLRNISPRMTRCNCERERALRASS